MGVVGGTHRLKRFTLRFAAWILLPAVAVPILMAPSAYGESSSRHALLDEAQEAIHQGQGLAAETKLKEALDGGVPRDEVNALMGQALIAQGQLEEARRWLSEGAFSAQSAFDGWRALANLERIQGNLVASGQAYDRALSIKPDDAALWVEIGRLRYAGGEHRQAIEAAHHAYGLDSKNVLALEFIGQLERDRKGLLAGLPWFRRALEIDPNDVSVLLELAALEGDLGKASECLALTRRALELAPKHPRAFYLQAVLATRAGNYSLAESLMERAGSSLDEQVAIRYLRGLLAVSANHYAIAVEAFEAVLKLRPRYQRAKEQLAQAILMQRQYRYLIKRFEADVENQHASPFILTAVARAWEGVDDRRQAGLLLDRATHLSSARFAVVENHDRLGDMLEQSQFEDAEAEVESQRSSHPGLYDAQSLAGDIQLILGRGGAAQERYLAAADIRGGENLFLRRSAAYDQAEDVQGKRRLIQTYHTYNPSSRVVVRSAATQYLSQGNYAGARRLLEWLRQNGGGRDVLVLSDLALSQAKLGDIQSAHGIALSAYKLQRSSPIASQALGYIYAQTGGEDQKANALLDKAEMGLGETPVIAEARSKMRRLQ